MMAFEVRSAQPEDVDSAVAALGGAFAGDPLMQYLFAESDDGTAAGTRAFFSILLGVRIALGMPAYVLVRDGDILGAAMGYDGSRPTWPSPFADDWRNFEAGTRGFAARLAAYEHICAAYEPAEDHYYLGVIGVRPSGQGHGGGKALLDAFCTPSRTDPGSGGVYLETASPRSLNFYLGNGFEVRGKSTLGATSLWCLYQPAAATKS